MKATITTYYSLVEAGFRFPYPLRSSSVYARITTGCDGVRLESALDGNNILVSGEAITRFLRAVTEQNGCVFGELTQAQQLDDESAKLYADMAFFRRRKNYTFRHLKRIIAESTDKRSVYLSAETAGQHFPVSISYGAVLNRMQHGVDGIRLACIFDGRSFYTTECWIRDFIQEITQKRQRRFPAFAEPPEMDAEQHRLMMGQIRNFGRKKRRKNSD